jgi:hypothetical protein
MLSRGRLHAYAGVTVELAAAFLASPSKGKFFHVNIRPLDGVKIDPPATFPNLIPPAPVGEESSK